MPRKATPAPGKPLASSKQTRKSGSKAGPAPSAGKNAARTTGTKQRAAATKRATPAKQVAAKTAPPSGKTTRKTSSRPRTRQAQEQLSPSEVLARAEADVTAAIETLNQQMNAALETYTELASVQSGRGRAVVRTAPLDRATATFQRLVAEVVDQQLSEMLPPLIDLRNELVQRTDHGAPAEAADSEFCQRGSRTLDHVLTLAGATAFEARVGEKFDPLIHLAVGETCRPDLADGAVAESLQPGFRSARGKVLVPAKVKVNRR